MKTSIRLKVYYVIIMLMILSTCKIDNPYQEQHRSQFHFSPETSWMNDPNGLVFFEGEYHLFYQFYPDSTVWGPMHWGHAISNDLVHWKHLPIAIYPDSIGYIFSGSAVIDWKNTTGLQTGKYPPIITIFTQHSEIRLKEGRADFQTQSIAYSTDKGRTFVKYKHNPVILNPGEKDFRDPKVIWDESSQKWIMVLAAGQKVKFYSSSNLLDWDYLSDFGTDEGTHGGVWECPDLFPLKVGNTTKWVLLVSIVPGAPNGGSGTQYFIGNFNGTKFTSDNSKETVLWLDYGPDNYAGVTWSDIPEIDGRRIFIGWMSNWDYAQMVPTIKWRSAMTLPRKLELKNTKIGLRLYSNPVAELKKIRKTEQKFNLSSDTLHKISGLNEIIINIDLTKSSIGNFGFIFSNSKNDELVVGFDVEHNQYYIDRTNSGKTKFYDGFAIKHFAPRSTNESILKMHLFLDYSSLELFADDGIVSMTEIFFSNEKFNQVMFFQKNGKVKYQDCILFELNSTW